jgi:hypothetical protein
MTSRPKMPIAEPQPVTPKSVPRKLWCSLLSLLFGGQAASESVQTKLHIRASPETLWNRILFYEEISSPPPLLLRALIPEPVRTEGDKTTPGSTILCTYKQGHLVKRISVLETRRLLAFEVVEQHLGIESCIVAKSGSYKIRHIPAGTQVLLTTNYDGHLRPRPLFRALEKLVIHQLHRHVLSGMRDAVAPASSPVLPVCAECAAPTRAYRSNNQ